MPTFNDKALQYPCPACQAKVNEPCTQPTNTGRKPVGWYHYARGEK